jgi:hypothetical protein
MSSASNPTVPPNYDDRPEAVNRRKRWTPLAMTVVVGLLVLAWFGLKRTDSQHQAFDATVRELVIAVNGQVSIVAGDQTEVTLTREWTLTGAPRTNLDLVNGQLRVESECGVRVFPLRCTAQVTATVPSNAEVKVVISSGGITVLGIAGGVDLRTSAGSVGVVDVSGPARLRTDPDAEHEITAHSSAGNITIRRQAQP